MKINIKIKKAGDFYHTISRVLLHASVLGASHDGERKQGFRDEFETTVSNPVRLCIRST